MYYCIIIICFDHYSVRHCELQYDNMNPLEPQFILHKKIILPVCRLANILQLTKLDAEMIWKVVKKIKAQIPFSEGGCNANADGMYNDKVTANVQEVENKLNVKSSELKLGDITNENLENAGKMFVYLNMCLRDQWHTSWYNFYNNLFKNQQVNNMVLTLNRIMKSRKTPLNKSVLYLAEKLLKRITKLFSLKYNEIKSLSGYQGYENSSSEGGYNGTFKGEQQYF